MSKRSKGIWIIQPGSSNIFFSSEAKKEKKKQSFEIGLYVWHLESLILLE